MSSITFDQLLGNAPSSSLVQQQQKGFMGGDLIWYDLVWFVIVWLFLIYYKQNEYKNYREQFCL